MVEFQKGQPASAGHSSQSLCSEYIPAELAPMLAFLVSAGFINLVL